MNYQSAQEEPFQRQSQIQLLNPKPSVTLPFTCKGTCKQHCGRLLGSLRYLHLGYCESPGLPPKKSIMQDVCTVHMHSI